MLIEFSVSNFRSFREQQTISFVSSSDRHFPKNTFKCGALGNSRLVKSAVVYGPNASGKSNLIKALSFAQKIIVRSASIDADALDGATPFLLSEKNRNSPTEFDFSFVQRGVRYNYGFAVNTERVIEEWLYSYPKRNPRRLFLRTMDKTGRYDWEFGPSLKGAKTRISDITRENALFLSVAAQFANEQLRVVYDWFRYKLEVLGAEEYGSLRNQVVLGSGAQTAGLADGHAKLKRFIAGILRESDLGISDIRVEKSDILDALTEDLPKPPPSMGKKAREITGVLVGLVSEMRELRKEGEPVSAYKVKTIHLEADSGKEVEFPLSEESEGTRRFFDLIGPIVASMTSGAVLVVDEFDTSMHPMMCQHLLRLFHRLPRKDEESQLLVTTHDATLLGAKALRRDQIWFTEKDKLGGTHLYSLLEFKPRKDEALEKGYLAGRYGAIPFLGGDIVDG